MSSALKLYRDVLTLKRELYIAELHSRKRQIDKDWASLGDELEPLSDRTLKKTHGIGSDTNDKPSSSVQGNIASANVEQENRFTAIGFAGIAGKRDITRFCPCRGAEQLCRETTPEISGQMDK
eukprot:Em0001g3041a